MILKKYLSQLKYLKILKRWLALKDEIKILNEHFVEQKTTQDG